MDVVQKPQERFGITVKETRVVNSKRHFWQHVNKSKRKSDISARPSLSLRLLLIELHSPRLLGGTPTASWITRAEPLSIGLSRGKGPCHVVPKASLAGRKTDR